MQTRQILSSDAEIRIDGMLSAFENMRRDDELLKEAEMSAESRWILRIYMWEKPSISLGVSQTEDILIMENLHTDNIDYVKRATGGRAVFHRNEITYALAARNENAVWGGGLYKSYRAVSSALLDFYKGLQIPAEIIRTKTGSQRDPVCFHASALYELSAGGRKLCGSAQKRSRSAFLQHGSLPLFEAQQDLSRYIHGAEAGEREAVMADFIEIPPLDELAARLAESFLKIASGEAVDEV